MCLSGPDSIGQATNQTMLTAITKSLHIMGLRFSINCSSFCIARENDPSHVGYG